MIDKGAFLISGTRRIGLARLGLAAGLVNIFTMDERYTYEASCKRLQAMEIIDRGEIPLLPETMPSHDDEGPLGVSFFRSLLQSGDLSNMTLPRTYFGRSEIRHIAFRNCDLSESRACWNDFLFVNFSGAILTGMDFRASILKSVNFEAADLTNADFRHCDLEKCKFGRAIMSGVKMPDRFKSAFKWTKRQLNDIEWCLNAGEEPPGG